MRSKTMPILFAAILVLLIGGALLYMQNKQGGEQPAVNTTEPAHAEASAAPMNAGVTSTEASPSPGAMPAAGGPTSNPNPDLTVDANGLSKATVVMTTTQGVIRFKFYPQDAPGTVKRIIELINMGFYNGLSFHRVVPGFVVQGGDPQGTGAGGSGVKLKAEFNKRKHVEGTVAMARAQDPDSADSQFYVSLGTHPHLDNAYTVFGQVIEGMDVARKIQVGDKMISVRIE